MRWRRLTSELKGPEMFIFLCLPYPFRETWCPTKEEIPEFVHQAVRSTGLVQATVKVEERGIYLAAWRVVTHRSWTVGVASKSFLRGDA